MVKNLQQKYLLAIFITSIQFCFGTQCHDECCYWYRRFPATPSSCRETNRTTVVLFCEIQYWALNNNNSIEVNWYRSRDEESAGVEGEIILNNENKYLQFDSDPTIVNQTFIKQYTLGILRFSSSDRGYYWCQMVVNNVSLSPSPYGHLNHSQCITLDAICDRDQPICAQNINVRYMALRQWNGNCSLVDFSNNSRTRITIISQAFTISKFLTSTQEIVTVTVSSFPTTEMAPATKASFPITEVVSTIVVVIILFMLTILLISSIIYIKRHKGQSKELDLIIHHCEKFELEECKDVNDIPNPHYMEIRIATDHNCFSLTHEEGTVANDLEEKSERGTSGSSKTEHDGSNPKTQQHPPYPEVEEIAQINSSHRDQIKNQESHSIHTERDVSSEYAAVDKSKKISKLQSNDISATRADSVMENPQYDKLNQDKPTKDIVTSKEGEDQVDNLREKSPSPEYAELSTSKKVPAVTKYLTEKEKDNKAESDLHQYDKVAGGTQASTKVTKGDTDDSQIEQHYYYTLENPEESCSNSKRNEETTNTINSGEMEYNMAQAHHLVKDNIPVAPNMDAKAELVSVSNASPLDLLQGEASADNT